MIYLYLKTCAQHGDLYTIWFNNKDILHVTNIRYLRYILDIWDIRKMYTYMKYLKTGCISYLILDIRNTLHVYTFDAIYYIFFSPKY